MANDELVKIRLLIEVLLAAASNTLAGERLAGNVIKEAAARGEVVMAKTILAIFQETSDGK